MRRTLVASIWIGGLLLAAALYQDSPDRLIQAGLDFLAQAADGVGPVLTQAADGAFDALRAVAVAVFVVFLLLCLLAAARGVRLRLVLLPVTAAYLLLTLSGDAGSVPRWAAALALAAVGAVVMTRRLMHVPSSPAVRR